jgi:hypothetical protein
MNAPSDKTWHDCNQDYLSREIAALRLTLQGRSSDLPAADHANSPEAGAAAQASAAMHPPPAVEQLSSAFGLSRFERATLLLCAGVELDAGFAQAVAAAQQDPRLSFPTFGLALAALDEPHWSALSPAGPLRRWRMIELTSSDTLTTARLRIDERVLHYLAGVSYLDDRLAGLLEAASASGELPASHGELARQAAHGWAAARGEVLPVIQLCGADRASKRAIAATACARVGLGLYILRGENLPVHGAELDAFMRLWQREAIFAGCALLIELPDGNSVDPQREAALARLLEDLPGAVIFSGENRRLMLQRRVTTLEVDKPTKTEQRALWQQQLGSAGAAVNGKLDAIGSQFNFAASAIRSASDEALQAHSDGGDLSGALWDICRAHARPRLNDLAQRIVALSGWDDLVLPDAQKQILRQIAMQVRQRAKVYDVWGFGAAGARGLGIGALFAGPSGTGKTMAGEVLARELNLDLYRIDLSQVVNKYIGETEKNLRRVFDAAEESGAILLFDEADALFGKRSEVKDSHDRYANIEISYLLQRMEAYSGLAILTTNMKSALDTAFLRRLRFVVQFPFPDAALRAEIWRRIFPTPTPTEGLDFGQLARLQVSGGNIRNMALNAAFLAAEANQPVGMGHLLHAAKSEYAKLERPLAEAEIGGWR